MAGRTGELLGRRSRSSRERRARISVSVSSSPIRPARRRPPAATVPCPRAPRVSAACRPSPTGSSGACRRCGRSVRGQPRCRADCRIGAMGAHRHAGHDPPAAGRPGGERLGSRTASRCGNRGSLTCECRDARPLSPWSCSSFLWPGTRLASRLNEPIPNGAPRRFPRARRGPQHLLHQCAEADDLVVEPAHRVRQLVQVPLHSTSTGISRASSMVAILPSIGPRTLVALATRPCCPVPGGGLRCRWRCA